MKNRSLSLVVFDLDFTVWDAGGVWCDCLSPPFVVAGGKVVDSNGDEVRVYPAIFAALDYLESRGVPMAVASRTNQPRWALELLSLLGLADRFAWSEIYPSSKVRHFNRLSEASGFAFAEMLFFDDERRNIEEVGAMGVEAVHVESGFRLEAFDRGLSRFQISREGRVAE